MKIGSLWLLAIGFAVLLGFLGPERAAAQVRVGWSAVAGPYLPLWVAYEAGYFKKHGVDLELIKINGGSLTAQALVGGSLQVGALGGPNVILSKLAGSDLVMFLTGMNTLDTFLITTKDVKDPSDLKGKQLGINRFGTSSDFALRYLLKHWGLDSRRDVKIVQVGNLPEVLAAMQAGGIKGGITDLTLGIKARQIGFQVMSDMSKLNIPFQHTGIAASKNYLARNRGTMLSFARAYVEGIRRIKTDKEFTESVLSKYFRLQDRVVLEETYNFYSKLIPQKPYPTLEGVAFVLEQLGKSAADASDFVDDSVLKEVDTAGFIDILYKGIKK
jgi:NitT/TauT family transport system substrate-binding protein